MSASFEVCGGMNELVGVGWRRGMKGKWFAHSRPGVNLNWRTLQRGQEWEKGKKKGKKFSLVRWRWWDWRTWCEDVCVGQTWACMGARGADLGPKQVKQGHMAGRKERERELKAGNTEGESSMTMGVRWQAGLSFSRGSCLWIPIMSVFISLQGSFPKAWIIPY